MQQEQALEPVLLQVQELVQLPELPPPDYWLRTLFQIGRAHV